MNLSEWKEQGVELAKAHKTQNWALADWLAAGDTAWGGKAYDEAQVLFPDKSRKYLYEMAYVGRNVHLSCRQENLSFSHHQLVSPLPPVEQERALQKAVEYKWSTAQLRKWLRDVVLKESPFSVPMPKDLFAQLDQFARLVKMAPESLVCRAVQLFLANPPADIATEYETGVAAEREECRLREERRMQRLAEIDAQEAAERRSKAEYADFWFKAEDAVRPYESFLRRTPGPEQEAWRELRRLSAARTTPALSISQQKLSELVAMLLAKDLVAACNKKPVLALPPGPAEPQVQEEVAA